ncbi:cell division protein DrpB [Trabulsiella odontotermitis]|uniref:Cell division protein DrpB n=1 Tax=Trabulsiella odontotermitis TaxID=379893 RepID=A0A0L0GNW7_9ENTR|nr:cell division protein DrpB [Trabulsiella odontotermitis]KNC90554.1 membrane protein [Trabulsiella odontotermitis]KNC94777.1 membrane protein [Trabulsiella odontotermitis]
MEERVKRGPGGKLALWVFYAFCGYFVWAMARYFWVISQVQIVPGTTINGELGSTAGIWLGALMGFIVLALVGGVLGYIAWVTRPPQIEE